MAIVSRDGYPIEVHPVVTRDGFILQIFRIPRPGSQPVVLQHGIFSNGGIWVDKHDRSLGFQLYSRGKDVWISTFRATTYGKDHLNYSTSDDAYWNWNLDTLVEYDMPAVLEYIVKTTGKEKEIIYIGHSMGTTMINFYAAAYPEKAVSQLKGIISLAPVAYVDENLTSKIFSPFSNIMRDIYHLFGIGAFFRDDSRLHIVADIVCRIVPHLCSVSMELFAGHDPGLLLPEEFLLGLGNFPVSISVDTITQYLQIGGKKRLQKFDYGKRENLKRYQQEIPPTYDMSKVTIPSYLFHGPNDLLSMRGNVERLYNELSSKRKQIFEVSGDGKYPYNHMDFVYASNLNDQLYPLIFRVIDEDLEGANTTN